MIAVSNVHGLRDTLRRPEIKPRVWPPALWPPHQQPRLLYLCSLGSDHHRDLNANTEINPECDHQKPRQKLFAVVELFLSRFFNFLFIMTKPCVYLAQGFLPQNHQVSFLSSSLTCPACKATPIMEIWMLAAAADIFLLLFTSKKLLKKYLILDIRK